MKKRLFYFLLAALSGSVLLVLTLFWMGAASPAQANPGIRYVAPPPTGNDGGGNDCTNSSSPCATIQYAIDVSIADDEVRVAQGTYYEAITLTKSVMLEGGWNADFAIQDWDTYVTTMDAQGLAGSVIRVEDTVSPTIEGFVITGGDASNGLGWGGGIVVYHSGPGHGGLTTIRHNVVTDNIACQFDTCLGEGGGIMVYNSDAIIEHNTIISNVARTGGDGGGKGGGISFGWSSNATVSDNAILSNTAVISPTGLWDGQGGGVYMGGSSVTLIGNEIRGNVAAVLGTGRGGGVYGEDELYDNQILSNTASISGTGYGGGVYAYSVFQFHNNLVQGNVASQYGDGTGGGIYANQLQRAYYDTIVDNTATRGGGLYLGQWSSTELRDCLITRNSATGSTPATLDGGGGIASVDDDPQITDSRIVSNTSNYLGGGLLITSGSDYLVQENTINGNEAPYGGGVYVYSSTGTINDNWIITNTAHTSGGGLYLTTNATATLDSNRILSNSASTGHGGGFSIYDNLSPVTLTNQVMAHNSATLSGGGLYVSGSTAVRLINSTLVNDRSTNQEGVALWSNSRLTMTNNIVIGHHIAVNVETGSAAVLTHNDYWDNDIGVAGQISGTTDMTLDPQFEDRAAGDYHLALTSLLIDAGDNSVSLDHDFEGDPRPRGSGIDVGADEAYQAESYVSDYVGSDVTGDGSPGYPFATVTKALSETRTGGTVYVGRGTYTENITLTRSVNLQGGYHESDWSRDISAYTTALDGGGAWTVVTIRDEDVQALIEGFTITGGVAGSSGYGGGILVEQGAATIRRNRITGNHAGNAGGGLVIFGNEKVESVVESNRIYGNTADGIGIFMSSPGGGALIWDGPARVVNNFIYSNTSALGGDGMALAGFSAPVQTHHNTVVDNGGAGSEGVVVWGSSPELYLYNNLIVGHGTGISATATTQAVWDYSGLYDNDLAYAPGLTGGTHDQAGDPLFAHRSGGDYHLNPGSPMINQGMEAGVSTDIDGDPRPIGPAPDIGADEQGRYVYLPLILRYFK